MGYDPLVQALHTDDAVQAILLALDRPEATGVFNIAPEGVLPISSARLLFGSLPVPVPHGLAYAPLRGRVGARRRADAGDSRALSPLSLRGGQPEGEASPRLCAADGRPSTSCSRWREARRGGTGLLDFDKLVRDRPDGEFPLRFPRQAAGPGGHHEGFCRGAVDAPGAAAGFRARGALGGGVVSEAAGRRAAGAPDPGSDDPFEGSKLLQPKTPISPPEAPAPAPVRRPATLPRRPSEHLTARPRHVGERSPRAVPLHAEPLDRSCRKDSCRLCSARPPDSPARPPCRSTSPRALVDFWNLFRHRSRTSRPRRLRLRRAGREDLVATLRVSLPGLVARHLHRPRERPRDGPRASRREPLGRPAVGRGDGQDRAPPRAPEPPRGPDAGPRHVHDAPVPPAVAPPDGGGPGLPRERRASSRARRAGRRLPRGDQGGREALPRPLPPRALRPRRLRPPRPPHAARRSFRSPSSGPRRSTRTSSGSTSSAGRSACRTSRSRPSSRCSGPLGTVPLPTKWWIDFGKPIVFDHGPDIAERPMIVNELADKVRTTLADDDRLAPGAPRRRLYGRLRGVGSSLQKRHRRWQRSNRSGCARGRGDRTRRKPLSPAPSRGRRLEPGGRSGPAEDRRAPPEARGTARRLRPAQPAFRLSPRDRRLLRSRDDDGKGGLAARSSTRWTSPTSSRRRASRGSAGHGSFCWSARSEPIPPPASSTAG